MTAYAALIAGTVIFCVVVQDAFEVMLLPRRVKRRLRFVRIYFRLTWAFWTRAAVALQSGARRERFLGIYGALAMILLFAIWATGLVLAFGLVQWWAQQAGGSPPWSNLGEQTYMSGVTFFTLGYGDVVPRTGVARVVAVFEAGVGFGMMAVVIGYLPVLYQMFARREAHVLQLDARAGSPPTASALITRHAESGGLDKVDGVLRTWELWAADLLESHLSYPMLAYYRSQHADQSWLGALAAVMDTCALILVGIEDVRPLQARMTFAMTRQVVVEMARSLELTRAASVAEPRLDGDGYRTILEHFSKAGVKWNGGDDAEETLASLRSTYEPTLAALADYLLIPLPVWVAESEYPDHWERGARGLIARRLVGGLSDGSLGSDETAGRRLRDRLKSPQDK